MALQSSDLLYLERAGTIYQTTWGDIQSRAVSATDLALILRGGVYYKVAIGDFWSCSAVSQAGDLFLIERNKTLYHEEILFPCSIRVAVSGASSTTFVLSGVPDANGDNAYFVKPDGTKVQLTSAAQTFTFPDNGTYEFFGNLTGFQITASDGLVDADLDPTANWTNVMAGVTDFGAGTFQNINNLVGLPGSLPVKSLDGTFAGSTVTASNLDNLDTSIVTSAVGTFKDSGVSPSNDLSAWDVSNVTTIARMFENAVQFNNDISAWDIANVTNMSRLFLNTTLHNQDLSAWGPSLPGVTNMSSMFGGNVLFNQDLTLWNVSTVEDFSGMFANMGSFNQDLGDWDTSVATNMDSMFFNSTVFDQDLSEWCVNLIPTSPVQFSDSSPLGGNGKFPVWGTCPGPICGEMYFTSGTTLRIYGTTSAAGKIVNPNGFETTIGPGNFTYASVAKGTFQLPTEVITKLNFNNNYSQVFDFAPCFYTGNITDMSNMFYNCRNFRGDISNWDMSNVTNTFQMFENCYAFNGDVSGWDVSGVTDARRMFMNARTFDQDISAWDMSSVVYAQNFFRNAEAFNQDLPNWDLSNAENIGEFFTNAKAFNGDISGWQIGNAQNFLRMFSNAPLFNGDISAWDTSSATNMVEMFEKASSFNRNLDTWDVGNVENMYDMFQNATSFNQDINSWDVAQVANMANMFRNAIAFNHSLNDWDVTGVPSKSQMANMFRNATSMEGDISNWCVGSITSEPSLFDYGASFEDNIALLPSWGGCPIVDPTGLIINNFNGDRFYIRLTYTSNSGSQPIITPSGATITASNNLWYELTELGQYELPMGTVSQMLFNGQSNNTSIDHNVDFTFEEGFYTKQITNMRRLFHRALQFNGNVTNWNTSKVTHFGDTFSRAGSFNGDVGGWDVSNGTTFAQTFDNATAFNQDLSQWDVSKGQTFMRMFTDATVFNSDLSRWDVSNGTNMYQMFKDAPAFNSYLNPWDVTNVANMYQMFTNATAMQGDISNWCVPQFSTEPSGFDTNAGFEGDANLLPTWGTCKAYNGIYLRSIIGGTGDFVIGGVTISNDVTVRKPDGTIQTGIGTGSFAHKYSDTGWYEIQNMERLRGLRFFDNDLAFDDKSDGADWYFHSSFDTSRLTETRQMFREAKRFNSDISMFDLSNVTNMAAMFRNAEAFSQDVTQFDTANVNNMANMFRGSTVNQQIQNWEVYNVADMDDMFNNATNFNQDLSEWCVPLIGSKPTSFDNNSGFDGQTAIQPQWGTCPNAITILTDPVIAQVNGTTPAPFAEEIQIATAATKAPADAPIVRYQWQVSADGSTNWADIPVTDNTTANDASYFPNGYDRNQYVRVVVFYKKDGAPEVGAESNSLQVTNDDPPVDAVTTDEDAKVVIKNLGETLYGHKFIGLTLLGSDGVTTYGYLAAGTNDTYKAAEFTPFPVIKLNTNTGEVDVSQEMDISNWRFNSSTYSVDFFICGTAIPDGRHLLGTSDLQDFVVYDYTTNTQTFIPDPHGIKDSYYGSMVWSSVTNKAYAIPANGAGTDFVEVDVSAGTAVKLGYALSLSTANSGWYASKEGPNGKIYCLPYATSSLTVAELDPSTGIVELLPTGIDSSRVWSSAPNSTVFSQALYVSETNSIYGAPAGSLDFIKLDFDNLDGNGKPTITLIPHGQTVVPATGYTTRTYSAGIYKTSAGNIVSIPSSGASGQWVNPFLYLDTSTETVTSSPNTMTDATYSSSIWRTAILCQNGKVTAGLRLSFRGIASDDYWFPLINSFETPSYDHRDVEFNNGY